MKTCDQQRKCQNCKELFLPDYRNKTRQRFCSTPDGRKSVKRQRQQAWLAKPENKDHFRGSDNARRAREWQKEHPGYWKRTARYKARTLQDDCPVQFPLQSPVPQAASPLPAGCTLQDDCTLLSSLQTPLLVGLVSMLSGSTLQADIEASTRSLIVKGYDILGMTPGVSLERLLHEKTRYPSGATPESPLPVQLGRSSAGTG